MQNILFETGNFFTSSQVCEVFKNNKNVLYTKSFFITIHNEVASGTRHACLPQDLPHPLVIYIKL